MIPFFDLTGIPGMTELEREQEANSEPINITNFGFLFGEKVVTQAYVSICHMVTSCTIEILIIKSYLNCVPCYLNQGLLEL